MTLRIQVLAGLTAALLAAPASAHHSAAMYNETVSTEFQATVKVLEWTNPHAWLSVVEETAEGETEWTLELGSPIQLARQGWRPKTVVPGDAVTVTFHPHKDGVKSGILRLIVLPNGQSLGSE